MMLEYTLSLKDATIDKFIQDATIDKYIQDGTIDHRQIDHHRQ